MDPSSLTDEIIETLLRCDKIISNRRPKETLKAKHKELNLDVASIDGAHHFTLLTRQSTMIPESYSCGLMWHATGTQRVMLTRYNGSDHVHGNPIEEEEFGLSCHIHIATQRYLAIGRKIEHYASVTTRYNNLHGAMKCLMQDCNIVWASPPPDQDDRQGDLGF